MFGSHAGGGCRGGGRGGWGFDPEMVGWMWGGPGARRAGGRGGRRGGRMFEQGDLKFVILQLLDEKPRHGYEIIKELEERCGGAYTPSPGTVYPTLSLLEDLGYARAQDDGGGRKVYTITAEGRQYLSDNQGTVEDIFDRLASFGAHLFGGPMMEVHQAVREVVRATYAQSTRHPGDSDRLGRVAGILRRAAAELDGVGAAEGAPPAGPGGAGGSGGPAGPGGTGGTGTSAGSQPG